MRFVYNQSGRGGEYLHEEVGREQDQGWAYVDHEVEEDTEILCMVTVAPEEDIVRSEAVLRDGNKEENKNLDS